MRVLGKIERQDERADQLRLCLPWPFRLHPAHARVVPFLKAVAPETAVVSAGVSNQFGHSRKPVLLRLRQVKAKVFRPDQGGSVVIRSDGQKYEVETDK